MEVFFSEPVEIRFIVLHNIVQLNLICYYDNPKMVFYYFAAFFHSLSLCFIFLPCRLYSFNRPLTTTDSFLFSYQFATGSNSMDFSERCTALFSSFSLFSILNSMGFSFCCVGAPTCHLIEPLAFRTYLQL